MTLAKINVDFQVLYRQYLEMTTFEVLDTLKGLLKLETICIDNLVFKLHYKATMIMLVAFSILVTSKQYIGDPIDCLVDEKIPLNVMDTYCWIHTTFTLPEKFRGQTGRDMIYPGVGPETQDQSNRTYHKYYQWVCFVLFFQAILFYLPRYIWKILEGGRIKMLTLELNCPVLSEACKSDRKAILVEYFSQNLHFQNTYAYRFFICEAFNFINVIMQMYLMDVFFDGEFSSYGYRVLAQTEIDPELRDDPMSIVFPKITKCEFHKYGLSGNIVNLDGLCVLPLNIVNEKIYVFLWFWFVILAIITGFSLVFCMITILIPQFRLKLLRAQSRISLESHINIIAENCRIGDWFVLYQLGKNIDPLIYKELIEELAMKLDSKNKICETERLI